MIHRLRAMVSRFRSAFRRDQLDAELVEEMETHLAMLEEEFLQRGLAPDAARDAARRELGNTSSVRETHRDQRGFPWLNALEQDVRYALRTLRRDLGLAAFAVLIVALGVGASSAVFGIVRALILRPLPFEAPEQLIWIGNVADDGVSEWRIETSHLLDLRERSRSLAGVAGYFAYYGPGDTKLSGGGEAERLSNVPVTCDFFPVLGVRPLLGRTFTEEECAWGGSRAVLLSHSLWSRRFGKDRSILGHSIQLNGEPAMVVGVLPPDFDFATVFDPGARIDLFSAFPVGEQTAGWGNTLAVIGRLRPGATVELGRSEIQALSRQLMTEYPDRNSLRPTVSPLAHRVTGEVRQSMLMLAGAVAVVMLIVCANLSNLQLARGAARQREMAIRVALGAGRGRLIRQMLTESLVISLTGGALGLLLAVAAVRAIASLDAFRIPLLATVRIDGAVVGTTVLVAVAAGVIFGLMPALSVPTQAPQGALRESGRSTTESRGQRRFRAGLVAVEVALAIVLVTTAGLLYRSFVNVLAVDPGFRPQQVAAMRVDAALEIADREARNAHLDDLLRRTREVPGVTATALADVLPLDGDRSWAVSGEGQIYQRGEYPQAFVRMVSEGYFRTLTVPLRSGRDFSARDDSGHEPVAIVNETLARLLWPGQDAVGQRVRDGEGVLRQVVGVVGDVHHASLEEGLSGELYLPIRQTDDYGRIDVVVRSELPLPALATAVRTALAPLEPDLPRSEWRSLEQIVDRTMSPRRFVVLLLGSFAVFAVVLASLGLYAVVSYSVTRRIPEIGVRMALGASAGVVRRDVLMQTLRLASAGLVVGLIAALAAAHGIAGLLYETAPLDPATFALSAVLLLMIALLAGYLPARRASALDPTQALRAD